MSKSGRGRCDACPTQSVASNYRSGGDFVWIIKDNQFATRQAIELLFTPQKPLAGEGRPPMDFQTARTLDKGHGRLEERIITVSSLLNEYLD